MNAKLNVSRKIKKKKKRLLLLINGKMIGGCAMAFLVFIRLNDWVTWSWLKTVHWALATICVAGARFFDFHWKLKTKWRPIKYWIDMKSVTNADLFQFIIFWITFHRSEACESGVLAFCMAFSYIFYHKQLAWCVYSLTKGLVTICRCKGAVNVLQLIRLNFTNTYKWN